MRSQDIIWTLALCGFIAALGKNEVVAQDVIVGNAIDIQATAVGGDVENGLLLPDSQIALRLARDHRVLRELKCSLAQREAIEDALDSIDDALAELNDGLSQPLFSTTIVVQGAGGVGPAAGDEQADEENQGVRRRAELYEVFETRLRNEILKADQVRRLDEIELRLRGPRAFRVPRVIEALELTEEQNDFIREQIALTIAEIQQQSLRDLVIPNGRAQIYAPPSPAEMVEILEGGVQEIVDQFNQSQREIWQKLIGADLQRAPRIHLFGDAEQMMRGGVGRIMIDAAPLLPAIGLPVQE